MISSKLKISKRIAAVLLALFFAIGCSACKKTDNNQKSVVEPGAVIARIGDQTINYALFNAAFESYAEYMEQMGYSPYNSRSDLESFQNLRAVVIMISDLLIAQQRNIFLFSFSCHNNQFSKRKNFSSKSATLSGCPNK